MSGQARWRKSTRSAQTDQCVEVTSLADHIGVRDSKDPEGPRLGFGRSDWKTFIDGVKANAVDL